MKRLVLVLLAVALLVPLALLLTGGSAASGEYTTAGNKKFVTHNCFSSTQRPREIDLSCQDGDGNLERLNWSRWGGLRAKARGRYRHFPPCFPTCQGGNPPPRPVKVTLKRPRPCHKPHYRRVKFEFTNGKPQGVNRTERQKLFCPIFS